MKELLVTRTEIKAKKPKFKRHNAHKKKRLGTKWRRPKGRHNKLRLHKRGHERQVEVGFGSPVAVKGLHASGLAPVLITTVSALKELNNISQGAIIATQVGQKKKLVLLARAKELGIRVLNVKDIAAKMTELQEQFSSRVAVKKASAKAREARRKDLEKKAQEKVADTKKEEAQEKKLSPEEQAGKEKAEQEKKKKEQEKILIHKQ